MAGRWGQRGLAVPVHRAGDDAGNFEVFRPQFGLLANRGRCFTLKSMMTLFTALWLSPTVIG
jgi:hypothetical protein